MSEGSVCDFWRWSVKWKRPGLGLLTTVPSWNAALTGSSNLLCSSYLDLNSLAIQLYLLFCICIVQNAKQHGEVYTSCHCPISPYRQLFFFFFLVFNKQFSLSIKKQIKIRSLPFLKKIKKEANHIFFVPCLFHIHIILEIPPNQVTNFFLICKCTVCY